VVVFIWHPGWIPNKRGDRMPLFQSLFDNLKTGIASGAKKTIFIDWMLLNTFWVFVQTQHKKIPDML